MDKEIDYSNLAEDSHVLKLWEPLNFEITKNYKYVHNGIIFKIFSNLLYAIAYPILTLINKIFFGFKVEGKENYKKIKTGKVTVSNHVHFMDCTMIGISTMPQKTFFTSLASNFKIPIVKTLITLFNTVPIPTEISYKKDFITAIDGLLKNNKSVHFYPEGSLWPYYDKLRMFKNGAFEFAVRNQVPIIPCLFKFEESSGIRKYIKNKPCVKLVILEPIYPSGNFSDIKDAVLDLKNRTHNKMQEELSK
jgi:1-acyl-sn-glycerol-3-phosphate acyltransferase